MVWHFVAHFTYAGLFLALFGGALGLPIPDTVPVVAAGVLAHQGVIRWWVALPVCIAAAVGGDAALYWAGRHWGESVCRWRLVRRVLSAERQTRLLDAYRRHGVTFLFVSRHLIGVRTAASLTAGIARMAFWMFLTVDLAAVLASVPIGFGVAFLFSHQVQRLIGEIDHVERWVVLGTLVVVAAVLVQHYRSATKTTIPLD